jgi:hypothetical protein
MVILDCGFALLERKWLRHAWMTGNGEQETERRWLRHTRKKGKNQCGYNVRFAHYTTIDSCPHCVLAIAL